MSVALVWFRHDLRLADHPALTAALASARAVVPVFVWSPGDEGAHPPGAAARGYLERSLVDLDRRLRERGSRLVAARGPAAEVLPALAAATGAKAVHWSRRYEPQALRVEAAVSQALARAGIAGEAHPGSLLVEPWAVTGANRAPYRLYTPWQRAVLAQLEVPAPLASPQALPAPRRWPEALEPADLGLASSMGWQQRLAAHWPAGEDRAGAALAAFTRAALARYAGERDRPDLDRSSRLSPHLRHGELSPRQVWHAAVDALQRGGASPEAARADKFCSELLWRDFAAATLYHYPELTSLSLQRRYEALPWRDAPGDLAAWQRGRTGIELVDAGMRELWDTGWMPNRVRMVCASLLVKNLLVHWRHGAAWFLDTLVDADLASNALNWQWVAGTGLDAAPWFRIFNPQAQADRFDPRGDYRRRWLAPAADRPATPIVDLAASRARALAAPKESP